MICKMKQYSGVRPIMGSIDRHRHPMPGAAPLTAMLSHVAEEEKARHALLPTYLPTYLPSIDMKRPRV
jgi:hypothetical protein